MGFWLAALNPGPKAGRAGRRPKRRASAKQLAWRSKFAARFGGGKKRRSAKRRSHRRASAAQLAWRKKFAARYGGGKKSGKRRSTMKRRSLRRRIHANRSKGRFGMARTKTRRSRPRRNAWKGHRAAHARAARLGHRRKRRAKRNWEGAWHNPKKRSRKARRNAILATSWNPGRKRPKARRRNPLWKRRHGGKFMHIPAGRMMRRSRRTGRWHNNTSPVLATSWNPRRYNRNAVIPVSYNRGQRRRAKRNWEGAWHNPAIALPGVFGPVAEFLNVNFWTQTALPVTAGFIGTRTLGKFAWDSIPATMKSNLGSLETAARITTDAVAAGVLSWGVGQFVNKQAGKMVFIGGVVNVTYSVLQALLPQNWKDTVGLSGFGDDLSDRMKSAVAARVQRELSGGGVGSYLSQTDLTAQRLGMPGSGVGEFITDVALRAQPGYAPSPSAGSVADYDPLAEGSSI